MNGRPELERLVTDWLRADASAPGSDRVLAAALARVANVRQDRQWPLSRAPEMTAHATLGLDRQTKALLAVAAIVVVSVVGAGLLGATRPFSIDTGSSPASGASPSANPRQGPPPALALDVLEEPILAYVPYSVTMPGVSLSFSVRTPGWESHGRPYISKSYRGGQGAGAIIYWATFPDTLSAYPCFELWGPQVSPTASDLAAAVVAAPGTELVAGPSDVTLGGLPAKHLIVTIRERLGCEPGYFYGWTPFFGGALWPTTQVGDTIRVWIVDADGTLLFIGGATHEDAGPNAAVEVDEIVGSMQIDNSIAFGRDEVALRGYLDRVDAICSVATNRFRAAERQSRITVVNGNAVGWVFDDAEWSEAAVRISDEALAELGALDPPEVIAARMDELVSAMEAPLDVLRQVPAAASAGDAVRVDALEGERIQLTHRKDELVSSVAGDVLGAVPLSVAQRFQRVFQGCPVALPA